MKEAVILLGTPWAGKNTIAEKLAANQGYAVIESGKMSRSLTDPVIRQTVATGQQIPLHISHKCIADALLQVNSQNVVINGYPRHPLNARNLTQLLLDLGYERQIVLSLTIPDQVVFDRFARDPKRDNRPDNAFDTLLRRLQSYREPEVEQLEEYYRNMGIFHTVDARDGENEVYTRVNQTLK